MSGMMTENDLLDVNNGPPSKRPRPETQDAPPLETPNTDNGGD